MKSTGSDVIKCVYFNYCKSQWKDTVPLPWDFLLQRLQKQTKENSYDSQKISFQWSAVTWAGDPYPSAQSLHPPERPLPCPQGEGALHPDTAACWTPSPCLHPLASWPDGSAVGPRTPVNGQRPRDHQRAPWTTHPEHTETRASCRESCKGLHRCWGWNTNILDDKKIGSSTMTGRTGSLWKQIPSVPLWLINISCKCCTCAYTCCQSLILDTILFFLTHAYQTTNHNIFILYKYNLW